MAIVASHTDIFSSPGRVAADASDGATRGAVNLVLRLEGALGLAASVMAYRWVGGSWAMFALLFLAPDLSMLGYLAGPRVGAAAYNLGHSYLSPAALALLALSLGRHDLAGLALIWTAHIGFDRMLGYGLKYARGFGATHLGARGAKDAGASLG